MASRTIIIGYGNRDRADDGVAFAVINELRLRQGSKILEDGDTGLDDLNNHNDSIFIPQLVPEIMEPLTDYDRIVFVDAHVGPDMDDLVSSPVFPHYGPTLFTHHLTPSAFLAFLKALYRCEPEAHLVSIPGRDFDFRQGLSQKAQALVGPAVDMILELLDQ